MGNYKFRLSDMIPNAWFYKLKDMTNNNQKHSSTTTAHKHKNPRQSFYYKTWEQSSSTTRADQNLLNYSISPRFSTKSSHVNYFPDPPRRSSKRRSRRKPIYKPSPKRVMTSSSVLPSSQDYNNFDSSTDVSFELDFLKSPSSSLESFNNGLVSRSSSCSCGFSYSTTDIIIDVNEKSFTRNFTHLNVFDEMPELDLLPILTKPASKLNDSSPTLENMEAIDSLSIKLVKEERIKTPGSRKSVSGIKIRANSPKLASKKIQGQRGRKSISSKRLKSEKKPFSESFAVVKVSFDPQKDFRDSMVVMIVENNIRESKDLEELLACYLSLNSDEYHELIIKAFEQIWFNMPDLQL